MPPWDRLATGPVAVHFAHRVVALVAAAFIIAEAARISRRHAACLQLTRPAWLLVGLVCLQIALGGFVVLSGRNIVVNTAHVANGALMLVTSLVVTLRAFRPLIREDAAEAARWHGRRPGPRRSEAAGSDEMTRWSAPSIGRRPRRARCRSRRCRAGRRISSPSPSPA